MQIDDRLQALAELVPEGCRAADIGTDHGYLAITLLREGRASFVVASDKNQGPYEAAKRTVRENAVPAEAISVRLGDGLQVLEPGEVDTACIAGMGGVLMISILEAAPDVTKRLTTLVLQPMNGAAELRQWLYGHGWHISDESLAVADGRIYEIIQARRGKRTMPLALDLLVGPVLWAKKPPLLRHHIEALLFQLRRVLTGMEKSSRAQQSRKYSQVKKQVMELEERLKW